jgi:hypothetical protein
MVTAEDKTTKQYTVTVTVAAPSTPSTPTPSTPAEPDNTDATVVVEPAKPVVDSESGVAATAVTGGSIADAIKDIEAAKAADPSKSGQLEIDVPKADTAPNGVAVSLPTTSIGAVAASDAVDTLIIKTEVGELELGSAALAKIAQDAGAEQTVTMSITKEDASALPAGDRPQMAGASVFDIAVNAGNTAIHELGGLIRINLPYTLKAGETAGNVRVYYIPDQGGPQRVAATYDSAAAKISFTTNHLSLWAVKADAVQDYAVTVVNGTGSGSYEEGAAVSITANAAPDGKVFDAWTSDDVTITNASSAQASFVMPAKAVTVTANYKDAPTPPATSGWVKNSDGTWKYLTNGVVKTGWFYDGGYKAWYYLAGTTGIMKTGWFYDQGKWYYLASSGAMKTGWVRTDGKWYYLAKSGAMAVNKWLKDTDGSWYYLSGNGKMLTGKQKVGGKAYSFRASGVWIG